MTNLTILVCLYNKDIGSSETIQSLLNGDLNKEYTKVLIWDNSSTSLTEASLDFLKNNFPNFNYNHTPENVALSEIYNSVIDSLGNENSYLMLCDDDSNIPNFFFNTLYNQIKANPKINLFLPKIYSGVNLVSPAKDYLITTKFIKKLRPGVLKTKNITAINSGMVLSTRLFQNGFRYDINLKFYGTDNYFMNHYAKENKNLVVLDVNFQHSLSFNSSDDINNKLRIFREIRRANKIIYSKEFYKRQLVLCNNLFVAIKLCIRYRTLEFMYY